MPRGNLKRKSFVENEWAAKWPTLTTAERRAVARVYRVKAKAPAAAILALVPAVRPRSILSAGLSDISAVADAF